MTNLISSALSLNGIGSDFVDFIDSVDCKIGFGQDSLNHAYLHQNASCADIRTIVYSQGDGVAGWKIGIDGGPSTPPIVTADTR